MILAARIAPQALAGEILVSGDTHAIVEADGDLQFRASRHAKLKGIAKEQRLVEVDWESR